MVVTLVLGRVGLAQVVQRERVALGVLHRDLFQHRGQRLAPPHVAEHRGGVVGRGRMHGDLAGQHDLLERAGADANGTGSITAIYTVLADGDDGNDPVVDSARSILDGHIVLSRQLAEHGVYPAIDVSKSVSRVMTDIAASDHIRAARTLRRDLATYEENRDLILMGAYRAGADPAIDRAIAAHPAVMEFIRQDADAAVPLGDAVAELTGVFGG